MEISVSTYIQKVIDLFKSGKATKRQWNEMASCVLNRSENDGILTRAIDQEILGSCLSCGQVDCDGYCD